MEVEVAVWSVGDCVLDRWFFSEAPTMLDDEDGVIFIDDCVSPLGEGNANCHGDLQGGGIFVLMGVRCSLSPLVA